MELRAAVVRLLIPTTVLSHRPPTAHGPSAPPHRAVPKSLDAAACTKGSRTLRDPALAPGVGGRGGGAEDSSALPWSQTGWFQQGTLARCEIGVVVKLLDQKAG